MRAGTYDMTCEQGSTFVRTLEIETPDPTDPTGETFLPFNLAGYTARMQVRRTVDSSTVLVSLTTENGRILINPLPADENIIKVFMTDEVTSGIAQGGVYDLEIESADGMVSRVLQGNFTLSPEVTR